MRNNIKSEKKLKLFYSILITIVILLSATFVNISNFKNINIKDNITPYTFSDMGSSIKVEKMVKNSTSSWRENVSQYFFGIVRFNITINNINEIGLYLFDITVIDDLSEKLIYKGNATLDEISFEPTIDNSILTWNIPFPNYSVAPGESIYLEYDVAVNSTGKITNSVEVTGYNIDGGEPLITNDTSNVTGIDHGIEISKYIWNKDNFNWSKNIDARPGDIITFNITIFNAGDAILKDSIIKDTIPGYMFEYVNNSAKLNGVFQNPKIDDLNLTWYNDSLIPSNKIELLYKLHFVDDSIGKNENKVKFTGFINDVNISGMNTVTINGIESNFFLDKKVRINPNHEWQDEINAWIGDIVRFNMTIDNTNGILLHHIWINDTLPENLEYIGNPVYPTHLEIIESPDNKSVRWKGNLDRSKRYIEFDAIVTGYLKGINRIDVIDERMNGTKNWFDTATVNSLVQLDKKGCLQYTDDWSDQINISVGETVRFKITINNPCSILNNVWINDTLPPSLNYSGDADHPSNMKINVSKDNKKISWNCSILPEGLTCLKFNTMVVSSSIYDNIINLTATIDNEKNTWYDTTTVSSSNNPEIIFENPDSSFSNKLKNITGEAIGDKTNISSMDICIYNINDDKYFNGIDWFDMMIWLDICPVDGMFNSEIEKWYYNCSKLKWTHNYSYNITIKTHDAESRIGKTILNLLYDTEKPTTYHLLDLPEPNGNDGWYISPVKITLNASDNGVSGIKNTYYKINGGNPIIYTKPFTVSNDGENKRIEYYSIDNASNIEETKNFTFDLDTTPPETTCDKNGWYNTSPVDAKLKPKDDTSGVNKTYYKIDNDDWWTEYQINEIIKIKGEGYHNITYYSTDIAGNVEGSKTTPINIDTTKPKIDILRPEKRTVYIANNKFRGRILGITKITGPFTINVSVSDVGSGIEKVQYFIYDSLYRQVNKSEEIKGPIYNWTWNKIQIFPGKYTIYAVAFDKVGNKKSTCIKVKLMLNLRLSEN